MGHFIATTRAWSMELNVALPESGELRVWRVWMARFIA